MLTALSISPSEWQMMNWISADSWGDCPRGLLSLPQMNTFTPPPSTRLSWVPVCHKQPAYNNATRIGLSKKKDTTSMPRLCLPIYLNTHSSLLKLFIEIGNHAPGNGNEMMTFPLINRPPDFKNDLEGEVTSMRTPRSYQVTFWVLEAISRNIPHYL